MRKKEEREEKPAYHAPCTSDIPHSTSQLILFGLVGKLKTVISGHMGWVRSVAVEPGNQWFATGAGDRVIKVRRKSPYKGRKAHTPAVDLGSGIRRVEAIAHGSHLGRSWFGRFAETSVSVLVR